ncbi:hypothetical protein ACIRPT_24685 [Streptomyces sp. NPDC101227]|uniref:hypothetical protein n=1 Tax=Streptomyces sp. NPDC101227 TaxID=3366136 RepID=UPI0037F94EEB
MNTVTTDPLFTLIETKALADQHVAALAAGITGAVRIPGILTPDDCAAAADAIENLTMGTYDPARMAASIARFGPALNDYRAGDGMLDARRYWKATDRPAPLGPARLCDPTP